MAIRHKAYADVKGARETLPAPSRVVMVFPGKDTLVAARDQVRRLLAAGPLDGRIEVVLQEGEYQLTETLRFDERDSGTDCCPVVWRAQEGKKVTVSGGVALTRADLSPVTEGDPLYARLPDPASTLTMDLKARHIALEPYEGGFGNAYAGENKIAGQNMTGNNWPELFWGDEALDVVRYPKEGYLLTVRSENVDDENDHLNPVDRIRFGCDDPRIYAWKEPENAWLQGYFFFDWANALVRVGRIDRGRRQVESAEPLRYGVRDGRRYYFLNVPEELRAAGQYYLDTRRGRLYLIPPEDGGEKALYLSCVRDALFRFDNASHIRVRGLRFAYARGSGVMIYGGSHVMIEGCELCNLGYSGVVIGCQQNPVMHCVDRVGNGGRDHTVRSCDIWNTAFGGINVAAGSREDLEGCGVRIENCDIHDFARLGKCYFFAVALSGVGAVVRNNRFHAGAHSAVWFDGNDNVIEYNEFYDLLRESDDAAAVYCGRDYTMGGNVIRYNFFHDMCSNAKTNVSVFGTYCDDNSASLAYYGNVYYRMQGAHLSHGGHDIVFENNLIARENGNSRYSVKFCAYGYPGTLTGDGEHAVTFRNAPTDSPLWHSRFPHLYEYVAWPPALQMKPHYCVFRNNALVDHRPLIPEFDWDNPEYRNAVDDNLELHGDIGFVDEENLDLRLREDSIIYQKLPGFKPIPFEKIGLYRDEFRR
ncbi:MAG: right-handed parallel beta-helix repeat-containing protein [Clostridia bacterium]|nr:right-handed parallel beta-helix repeat-containing protein [Clostridia bacterium]